MISEEALYKLKQNYPFLNNLSGAELDNIKNYSVVKTLPAGAMVFLEGDTCGFFSLIISGVVRVYKLGETGREITLYRFAKGESCILTASCILSSHNFPAAAAVEEEVEAVLIPSELLKEFTRNYDVWRKYFFDVLAERLAGVMEIINEVAFKKMDERISEYLLSVSKNNTVEATHQKIASELGTSREVVSRLLKDFENQGLISADRGKINIINPLKLKA